MMRSRVLAGFLLATCAFVLGCSATGMLTPMHLDHYTGDGAIARIEYVPNPGVQVEFEKFDLSHPYEATYRLDGLPNRPFAYDLDLVVPYPEEWTASVNGELLRVPGELSITVSDGRRAVVFSCSGTPWWSGTFGKEVREAKAGFAKCGGVRGEKPYILPEDMSDASRLPLQISVAWVPGTGASGLRGWFRLWSGGTT